MKYRIIICSSNKQIDVILKSTYNYNTEKLREVSNGLKRDILNLARQLKAGDALPDYVAGKI